MTTGHSSPDCPDWDDSIPSDRASEFATCVREAYQDADKHALHRNVRVQRCCWWHHFLFHDFVPISYYAGNFRQESAHEICLGRDVAVGSNPGASFHDVPHLMQQLEEKTRLSIALTEIRWPDLTPKERAMRLASVLATLIGRFIQIHPFLNGNGRTSRVIWAWGLRRFGVPIQCRIHPRPDPPYSTVMRKAMEGDFGPLALQIVQHLADYPPNRNV